MVTLLVFAAAKGAVESALTPSLLITVLAGLGLLGGVGLGIKAILERRTLNATAKASTSKAGSDDATAASIVAAAARELIDPLRQELATERAENAIDVQRERDKVHLLQAELDTAARDAAALRSSLNQAMAQVDDLQARLVAREERIVELEREIARYTEARNLNNDNGLDYGPHTA